jgi:IS1 family transposase/transposase-like protein
VTCHNCVVECKKAGKRRDGLQRYRCAQCGKTFSDRKEFGWVGHKQAVEEARALLALALLAEGNSISSAHRLTGLNKKTIMSLLVIAGEKCEALLAERVRNVPASDVQADEIWGFVGKKQANTEPGDSYHVGDAWCFIGIERNTKLILAFELGKRTVTSATRFITKLADATDADTRFQFTTDGLNVYPYPIGNILGDRVDYAQLVKVYKYTEAEATRRYSPAEFAESFATPVYGDPDEDRICTSHIERQNGSLRQWCKRLTRLTYAFSKKWEHHRAALAFHFAYYNFCRVHGTTRQTPAQAAGIADRRWTLKEMLVA